MNRQLVIEVGSLSYRGSISSGELPDLFYFFTKEFNSRGAKVNYVQKGVLSAQKNGIVLTLTIRGCQQAIPNRDIFEVLEEVMDKAFRN